MHYLMLIKNKRMFWSRFELILGEIINLSLLGVFMTCWMALNGFDLGPGKFSWLGLGVAIFGFAFIICIRIMPEIFNKKRRSKK